MFGAWAAPAKNPNGIKLLAARGQTEFNQIGVRLIG